MDKTPIRLMLTGGGTGGHLFPALATAEEMCSRFPGTQVIFIGTKRKMDTTSLEGTGYTVRSIYCYGLKGKSIIQLLKAIVVLPLSFVQALVHILVFKPNVVLGVGGYVTGPVMAAARLLGKRTIIHEQNSIPGLANRKLGKIVDKVCISLPQSDVVFPEEKTVFTGNPVRKPIQDVSMITCDESQVGERTVLVLGGSQGALRVNELAVEAFCNYKFSCDFKVIHQTGVADCDRVRNEYKSRGIKARVEPFIQNMAEVYQEADLLVSRAGATTLAELAVLGKPAVLIPYPYAADNHQVKNGQHYVEGGGCRMFEERDLSAQVLAAQLEELLVNNGVRKEMAEKMKKLGIPQAASQIVDVCIESLAR